MTDSAIRLQRLGKRYVKLEEQAMLLRSLLPFRRPKRSELWALRDVDVSIEAGETVGVLGRNGAGKTTLLRLLAGVTRPTEGELRVSGRIAPLISVGVGFNREMSGRENVFLNGMLLGLSRREVAARLDAIVAFAELDDFIDVPVKFYSTGMFMRLGFSVAVHVEPQILLVDEVLAVGDLTFQLKCIDKMRELQQVGTTIVLVSHSISAVRMLCPRALVISSGRLIYDGDSATAVARLVDALSQNPEQVSVGDGDAVVGGARIVSRSLEGPTGPLETLPQHETVVIRARVHFDVAVESPQVALTVVAADGATAYQYLPAFGTSHFDVGAGQDVDIEVRFVNRLAGGTYRLFLSVLSNDGRLRLYQDPVGQLAFVEPRIGSIGIAELDAEVTIDGVPIGTHKDVRLDRFGESGVSGV